VGEKWVSLNIVYKLTHNGRMLLLVAMDPSHFGL